MKVFLFSVVFVYSLLSFDYNLKPKKIGENTYCFFGAPEIMNKVNNGNMVNTCYVNMGESYLVIDSGPTYQYASQAHSKI